MLGPNDEYLSVNWLESTDSLIRSEQLSIVRQHLLNKGMRLPEKGKLAVLHLQSAFNYVQSPDSRRLHAHHEPELPHDPSHSGIYGYILEDQLIADLLAEAVQEVYAARG